MIRPLTIVACLLACGSGLYLYQSKHEVQLLDRTIERTVRDTNALREQSRLLAAEWTMLNDPERLRQFSNTYLSLKTITPSQFTSLADLDSRLPAPQTELPPRGTDAPELVAVAGETDAANPADPVATGPAAATSETTFPPGIPPGAAAQDPLPVPPIPATRPAPAVAAAPRPAEARPADTRTAERVPVSRPAPDNQPRPLAETRAPEQRTSEPRPSDQRMADLRPAEPRVTSHVAETRSDVRAPGVQSRSILPATPRPSPANTPINIAPTSLPTPSRPAVVATSAPFSGSLLGMARGSMPPAPRPTPVNAAYNSN
jgi:hypothetical protein